jgi:hypothetical protein
MPLSDYQAACDTIRSRTGSTEAIKSGDFAEKINVVYEVGKSQGGTGGDRYEEGYTEGIEQGKQAERETYWNSYLNSKDYANVCDYMFAGRGWKKEIFNPTQDIKPTRAVGMFNMTGITGDLVDLCEKAEITIDFSNCKLFNTFATNANGITRFGILDISKATDNISFTNATNLITIDKMIVSETTPFSNTCFNGCSKFENILFEGVIAKSINFQWSPKLSRTSTESGINHLSSTTTGLSATFSLIAVKKAFETSEGANDGDTSEEWLNLIATKPNWTINLV